MQAEHAGSATAAHGVLVRVGLRRFDRLFDVVIGVFGVLFALQTADSFVADLPSLSGPLGIAVLVLIGASVLAGLSAVVARTRARLSFLAGASLYVIALLLWPLAIRPPVPTDPMPFVVAVWPIAAAFLTQAARSRRTPIAVGVGCSLVAALTLRLRGGLGVADSVINGLFMVGLAVILVLLLGTVRRGIVVVARSQQAALDAFAETTVEDATEQERVRTDALLHDAVLTTFLSAAAAETPDAEDLVARMAVNSLRVLMHVNEIGRDEAVLPFGRALAEQRERMERLRPWFAVETAAAASIVLPETVARNLVAVMLAAMDDGVRSAPDATHRVHADRLGPDGIRILVEHDGPEADPDAVRAGWDDEGRAAADRLREVEGRVDVRTGPDGGTSVQLSWGSVVIVGTTPLPAPDWAVGS